MKINIFVKRKMLFEYERFFIRKLYEEYPAAEIAVIFKNEDFKKHPTNYFSFIDRRFTNFYYCAFSEIRQENFESEFKKVSDKKIQAPDFTIYLYHEEHPVIEGTVYMFDDSYRKFIQQYQKKSALPLFTFRYNTTNCKWEEFGSLLMDKERGISNNREKYYFYSMILLLKTIRCNKKILAAERKDNSNYHKNYLGLGLDLILRKLDFRKKKWKIAILKNGNHRVLKNQEDEFWADPFYLEDEGKQFIFFEELNEAGVGEISVLESADDFNNFTKKTVLRDASHFSFPNVFNYEGKYYMLPESSEKKELAIYECENFPDQWKKRQVLIDDIKALDPVWVKHHDKYFMFANVIQEFEYDNNECLYIFWADDLFGTWHQHAQNPVITSKYGARNAGKIFIEDGKMYRPSQNCMKDYGKSVIWKEIVTLSETEYEEKAIVEINPPVEFSGLHTYNKVNDIWIVDLLE